MQERAASIIGPGTIEALGAKRLRESAAVLGGDVGRMTRDMYRETPGPKAHPSWAAVEGGEERWHADAPVLAPGCYLHLVLLHYRTKDRNAKPRDSDWTDDRHVAFVPYADIATVDTANLQRIESMHRHIGARGGLRREGKVLRNGDHGLLLGALRVVAESYGHGLAPR